MSAYCRPKLSPLSLILFWGRVSINVFSRFGFMTYMFFLFFFLIWYLQGVKAKRVAQKKKSIVNKNRVIHFLTFSNNGGNCWIWRHVTPTSHVNFPRKTGEYLRAPSMLLILSLFWFFFQMEQYSKALKILVYKLEDYAEAERFCELHSKVNKNARLSTNM